jgi:selenocysteine lyase/cysteine desulfurase
MGIPAEDLKTFADCTDVNTPGMVRLSLGIYNTEEEIDEFLSIFPEALEMAREDMKHFMKIVPEY